MIDYTESVDDVTPADLNGFFVGWPHPPGPEVHLRALRESAHVVVAKDGNKVVGFVNAISDGVLAAFIPMIEVLPEYQGRGIGSELLRRIVDMCRELYSVDLVCDWDLEEFYEDRGWSPLCGMGVRNYDALGSGQS